MRNSMIREKNKKEYRRLKKYNKNFLILRSLKTLQKLIFQKKYAN